jgi:hypothetical protein
LKRLVGGSVRCFNDVSPEREKNIFDPERDRLIVMAVTYKALTVLDI